MRRLSLVLVLTHTACAADDVGPRAGSGPGIGAGEEEALPPPRWPAGLDYLIVAGDGLTDAATRYAEFRASTGHVPAVVEVGRIVTEAGVSQADAVTQVADEVAAAYGARDPSRPFFVLLIGDADVTYKPGMGWVPVGDEDRVTSDHVYADLDGDDVPELALGRLPFSDAADVDRYRERVAAHESTYKVGPWNRRINLFASPGGFGESADAKIEKIAFDVVSSIPDTYDITMTYAKQDSPYVYVPGAFSDKVYERINEGSLMVAYLGHGYEQGFARLDWGEEKYPILDASKVAQLDTGVNRSPILTFIACSTGSFDTTDSISEVMLRQEGGPVAILSSTEVSHPFTNSEYIYELSKVLGARPQTLGAAFVESKRLLLRGYDALRREMRQLVTGIIDDTEANEMAHSHTHMYTLFGDPALRLQLVREEVPLAVEGDVEPGEEVLVTGSFAGIVEGTATVTLEVPRGALTEPLAKVPADDDLERDAVIASNYAIANDPVLGSWSFDVREGLLTAPIPLPALEPGTYLVKVYADDGVTDAAGAARLTVSPE